MGKSATIFLLAAVAVFGAIWGLVAIASPDACRSAKTEAADATQRLVFTGKMARSDAALFEEVVIGYSANMRRSVRWSASVIESALRDQASVRSLNRELFFMSPKDESEIGIAYGDWSMSNDQARRVLKHLKRRLPTVDACGDV